MKPEGTPVRLGDLVFDYRVIKPSHSRRIGLEATCITGSVTQTTDSHAKGLVLRENSGSEFQPNGKAEVVGNRHVAMPLLEGLDSTSESTVSQA
jgi:hypothetical protein